MADSLTHRSTEAEHFFSPTVASATGHTAGMPALFAPPVDTTAPSPFGASSGAASSALAWALQHAVADTFARQVAEAECFPPVPRTSSPLFPRLLVPTPILHRASLLPSLPLLLPLRPPLLSPSRAGVAKVVVGVVDRGVIASIHLHCLLRVLVCPGHSSAT